MSVATESALALSGLHAGYGRLEILRGLELDVAAGEIMLVIGHNGAGKSTLAKAALGLTDYARGRIVVGDRDVSGLGTSERVRAGIGYVPQAHGIFPSFTVRRNFELAGYTRHGEADVELLIGEQFERFPALRASAGRAASLLSGGQQRMLSIGMAMMNRPRVVFVDEPSAGLAPKLVDEVLAHLDVIRASGTGIVLIEQNVASGLRVADRVCVLRRGQVVGTFAAAELLDRESYWDLL
jgi:branched-chain amino acid transport system ATP-binding protein